MAPPPANPSAARKAPAINRINKTTFLDNLARSLPKLEPHIVSVPSPGSTELDILNLSDLLVSCATSAKVKSSIAVNSKNMPWWTPELCALRTKARTAFKSWSRSESSADEILYRLSKSGYQRALRRPKCKAWADFRRRASFGDTFKALAEFSGKAQSIPVPLELVVDGLPTSDPAVIAEGCADHFFPGEKPTEPLHVSIIETSSLSLSQINSDIPQSISHWEFEAAPKSLNCKSAPGDDGILAGLLLLSLPLIKPSLLRILNACFLLSFFPSP